MLMTKYDYTAKVEEALKQAFVAHQRFNRFKLFTFNIPQMLSDKEVFCSSQSDLRVISENTDNDSSQNKAEIWEY